MKTYLSDSEWEDAMSNAEDKILQFTDIPVTKDFIHFEMDGQPFRVRTFEFGGGDKSKKTLVFLSGYYVPALKPTNIFSTLSKRYRVITFDIGSFGMNTRLKDCSGYASHEAAEEWMMEFINKVFSKLNLPDKFFLASHCYGPFYAQLYAS